MESELRDLKISFPLVVKLFSPRFPPFVLAEQLRITSNEVVKIASLLGIIDKDGLSYRVPRIREAKEKYQTTLIFSMFAAALIEAALQHAETHPDTLDDALTTLFRKSRLSGVKATHLLSKRNSLLLCCLDQLHKYRIVFFFDDGQVNPEENEPKYITLMYVGDYHR